VTSLAETTRVIRRGVQSLPGLLGAVALAPPEGEAERDAEECASPSCQDGHDRYIGGQAILEGVMMRGRHSWGLSVRQATGAIATHSYALDPPAQRYSVLKWPVIRGIGSLGESLYLGVQALTISANLSLIGQEPEPGESKEEPQQLGWRELTVTILLAVGVALGLFLAVPLVVAKLFEHSLLRNPVLFTLAEGLVRVALFLAYLVIISRLPDLRRVFEYHGAEHKAIHSYEAGDGLDVKKALRYTTLHPRCGTAFLLVVMIMSILIFSLAGRPSLPLLILSRLVGIPLVIGLSYEVIKYAGRHKDGAFSRIMLWPGLLLQRLTTREPSEDQVEVALAALGEVLRVEAGGEPNPFGITPAPAPAVGID
jgi:uncharacterized protein YqhQ